MAVVSGATLVRSGSSRPTPPSPGAPARSATGRSPAAPGAFGAVWALLVVNTLAFNGVSILGFPHAVGQLVTMGALAAAFLLAVARNRRLLVRPNLFMTLLGLLALAGLASSMRMEAGPGSLLRSARFLVFVATLWLLTPLWRNPLALLRSHLRASMGVLAVVAAGVLVTGGRSLHGDQGRLVGAIWPMPPPQVGEFAAVLVGLLVTLWLTGQLGGRSAGPPAAGAALMLLLTHTRTSLAGLVIGVLLAAASAVLTNRRAGNFLATALGAGALIAAAAGPLVVHWLARGESSQELTNLTGRQVVWSVLLSQPRSASDRFLGIGLSDKTFGGLSIDSTWLSVYYEQGLIGVALVAAIFVGLALKVVGARPSPGRTVAVFLVSYLLVASYTEVGVGDASTYVLLAFLAAALVDHGDSPGASVGRLP